MASRYFELLEHIGVEPPFITDPQTLQPVANKAAGELQPMQAHTFTLGVPTMVDGELQHIAQTVTLEPIPGTRIVKIDDALIANTALQFGIYREIDPPTKGDLGEARKDTAAARQSPAQKEQ